MTRKTDEDLITNISNRILMSPDSKDGLDLNSPEEPAAPRLAMGCIHLL